MTTSTQKKKIRAAIGDYCRRAEKSQIVWHYSQQRPFSGFGKAPESVHVNDCSGYVSLAFNWAMHKVGVYMADPLGYNYTGFGYTGSMAQWLIDHGKPAPENRYLVGDIAINGKSLGTTNHTIICRQGGTSETSWWSSHGNENAPQGVRLHYHPTPVLGVWRHPVLV